MLKQFLESEAQLFLVVYYNAFRVNPLVNKIFLTVLEKKYNFFMEMRQIWPNSG